MMNALIDPLKQNKPYHRMADVGNSQINEKSLDFDKLADRPENNLNTVNLPNLVLNTEINSDFDPNLGSPSPKPNSVDLEIKPENSKPENIKPDFKPENSKPEVPKPENNKPESEINSSKPDSITNLQPVETTTASSSTAPLEKEPISNGTPPTPTIKPVSAGSDSKCKKQCKDAITKNASDMLQCYQQCEGRPTDLYVPSSIQEPNSQLPSGVTRASDSLAVTKTILRGPAEPQDAYSVNLKTASKSLLTLILLNWLAL